MMGMCGWGENVMGMSVGEDVMGMCVEGCH